MAEQITVESQREDGSVPPLEFEQTATAVCYSQKEGSQGRAELSMDGEGLDNVGRKRGKSRPHLRKRPQQRVPKEKSQKKRYKWTISVFGKLSFTSKPRKAN